MRPSTRKQRQGEADKVAWPSLETQAYGRAIIAGCDKAKVLPWHSHQLRHDAVTWLRREFGLDFARVVLGLRSPQITEQYAESDFGKAQEIMGWVRRQPTTVQLRRTMRPTQVGETRKPVPVDTPTYCVRIFGK